MIQARKLSRRGLVRFTISLLIGPLLVTNLGISQSLEQQEKPREITSADFRRTEPSKSAKTPSGPSPKRRVYRLVKTTPSPARKRVPNAATQVVKNQDTKSSSNTPLIATTQEQIGITFWQLRPSTTDDAGPLIRVTGDSGKPTLWTPVRVKAEHLFNLGDLIRLTVESPHDGYLYVIDRESYGDGSLGEPMLIFPTARTRDGDNRVSAGYLIDIPSWTDRVPYFMLSSQHANYAGELLTFVISPEPLQLNIGQRPLPIGNQQLENWENEWGTEADIYEMDGGVGEPKTEAEQQATRPQTRQLTQQEPVPQTIYRVNVRRGRPFLINVSVKATPLSK